MTNDALAQYLRVFGGEDDNAREVLPPITSFSVVVFAGGIEYQTVSYPIDDTSYLFRIDHDTTTHLHD